MVPSFECGVGVFKFQDGVLEDLDVLKVSVVLCDKREVIEGEPDIEEAVAVTGYILLRQCEIIGRIVEAPKHKKRLDPAGLSTQPRGLYNLSGAGYSAKEGPSLREFASAEVEIFWINAYVGIGEDCGWERGVCR